MGRSQALATRWKSLLDKGGSNQMLFPLVCTQFYSEMSVLLVVQVYCFCEYCFSNILLCGSNYSQPVLAVCAFVVQIGHKRRMQLISD